VRGVGFVVNPIAGMGGRVGLKGTDGVAAEARAAGAEPTAPGRAAGFLRHLRERVGAGPVEVRWLTCSGTMGAALLRSEGIGPDEIEIVYETPRETTAADTTRATANAVASGAELVLFCGGDGTARDVAAGTEGRVPILGIPAGVKMHSGVFAVSPVAAAEILLAHLHGELRVGEAELLDLDEDAYRRGEWRVRLHGTTRTLVEPHLVSAGKSMIAEVADDAVVGELADHFAELFEKEPDVLYLLGPGSTVTSIASRLGLAKTVLGIDAVVGRRVVEADVNEAAILRLLDAHPRERLVVSPIGAQGFVLGRGNLQVSPEVLRRIGTRNVIVVATPGKLVTTPILRVDTGDAELDEEFRKKEYLFVLIGYRTSKLHPIQR